MSINVFEWERLSGREREALCRRAEGRIPAEVAASVREILAAVRGEGDPALVRYTRRFAGAVRPRVPRLLEQLPRQRADYIRGGTLRPQRHRNHPRPGSGVGVRERLRPRTSADRLPGALRHSPANSQRRRDPPRAEYPLLGRQLRRGLQQRDPHRGLGPDPLTPFFVREFMKASSVACATGAGLETPRQPVATLALYESFAAHALAVQGREVGDGTGGTQSGVGPGSG